MRYLVGVEVEVCQCLVVSDLLRNAFNLIVREVDFDEIISLPKVLDESQLVEVANVLREGL